MNTHAAIEEFFTRHILSGLCSIKESTRLLILQATDMDQNQINLTVSSVNLSVQNVFKIS
jgi:hypothetical protein